MFANSVQKVPLSRSKWGNEVGQWRRWILFKVSPPVLLLAHYRTVGTCGHVYSWCRGCTQTSQVGNEAFRTSKRDASFSRNASHGRHTYVVRLGEVHIKTNYTTTVLNNNPTI